MRSNTTTSTMQNALPNGGSAMNAAPNATNRAGTSQPPAPTAAMGTAQTRAPQPPWLANRNGDARL